MWVLLQALERWTSSLFAQLCEGSWEYANPVNMCFVDFEKAIAFLKELHGYGISYYFFAVFEIVLSMFSGLKPFNLL